MQNVELIASYWTLAGGGEPHTDREYSTFDFKDRVEAAAKARSEEHTSELQSR